MLFRISRKKVLRKNVKGPYPAEGDLCALILPKFSLRMINWQIILIMPKEENRGAPKLKQISVKSEVITSDTKKQKKRGAYRGGSISTSVNSVPLCSSDEEE